MHWDIRILQVHHVAADLQDFGLPRILSLLVKSFKGP